MVVTLRLMSTDRLVSWLAATSAEYVLSRIKAGDTPEQAQANSDQSNETFFPGGVPAAGQLVNEVLAGGEVVGFLWVGPKDAGSLDWWVWDIEINAEHRGRGFGRSAMVLGEELALAHGAVTLGLNVFGYNTNARALYESLGYQTTAVQMRKPLDGRQV